MKRRLKVLIFSLLFVPSLLMASPLEQESADFIQRLILRLRQSPKDHRDIEEQYRKAVTSASQALRAYYGVNLEVYNVFDVELSRDQAAAQVHNALYILNQKRTELLQQSPYGMEEVRLFEINKDAIDNAFLEILNHQKDRVTSGVYEAMTQGVLALILSDIRVDVAMVRSSDVAHLPEDQRSQYEQEKKNYLELYRKLMQAVASDMKSRQAFEAMTGEKYSSLFHERDVYLDGPPLTHPFGRCQVIF